MMKLPTASSFIIKSISLWLLLLDPKVRTAAATSDRFLETNAVDLGQNQATKKKKAALISTHKPRHQQDQHRRNLLTMKRGGGEQKLSNRALAVAGATATMVGDVIMQPMDCIKTLQMSEQGSGLNIVSAAKHIVREHGFGGFYAGSLVYCLSDGVAGSLKFVTFEALKRKCNITWSNNENDCRKQAKHPHHDGVVLFLCAAIAGLVYVGAIVPGELIKQKLQMGQISSLSEGIVNIWANSGWMGFFTGFTGVCLRAVPYTMIELGLFDLIQRWYTVVTIATRQKQQKQQQQLSHEELIAIASVVGGIAGYITTPLDNIKTKIMLSSSSSSSKGIMSCAYNIVESNGVWSLFDGGVARVAWLMPFTAIYLPLYESIKRRMLMNNAHHWSK